MASIVKRKNTYSVVYSYINEHGESKQKWEKCANYKEAQKLKACGGGIEIVGFNDIRDVMDRFASDASFLKAAGDAAGAYVADNAGASAKIFKALGL